MKFVKLTKQDTSSDIFIKKDCYFSVIWGCCGLYWLINITYIAAGRQDFKDCVDPHGTLLKHVLASVILDIGLAGSEIFHRILLHLRKRGQNVNQTQTENAQVETGFGENTHTTKS